MTVAIKVFPRFAIVPDTGGGVCADIAAGNFGGLLNFSRALGKSLFDNYGEWNFPGDGISGFLLIKAA
jgi:hypothetical protein